MHCKEYRHINLFPLPCPPQHIPFPRCPPFQLGVYLSSPFSLHLYTKTTFQPYIITSLENKALEHLSLAYLKTSKICQKWLSYFPNPRIKITFFAYLTHTLQAISELTVTKKPHHADLREKKASRLRVTISKLLI